MAAGAAWCARPGLRFAGSPRRLRQRRGWRQMEGIGEAAAAAARVCGCRSRPLLLQLLLLKPQGCCGTAAAAAAVTVARELTTRQQLRQSGSWTKQRQLDEKFGFPKVAASPLGGSGSGSGLHTHMGGARRRSGLAGALAWPFMNATWQAVQAGAEPLGPPRG
ncbi:hypothetical protein PLESTB_001685300 [Pleodorina starrii]|uniref:Uncharacterized protein n=1 Tax=Pleodorina starrii TaxID=330485 RepID=A0A9W6F922_9CHLO|nr:hypothetical protein PLESTB_001685300 [Pleodorina starrii]GLC66680.1 hypothetical protein PLESTF_000460500 [Pleodorina starrii]